LSIFKPEIYHGLEDNSKGKKEVSKWFNLIRKKIGDNKLEKQKENKRNIDVSIATIYSILDYKEKKNVDLIVTGKTTFQLLKSYC